MIRPTFLVAEPEPVDALSTRKLVLETAKFNVITAHSGKEALELFRHFPKVHAVILVSGLPESDYEKIVAEIRQTHPKTKIVFLAPAEWYKCEGADHTAASGDPAALLDLLRLQFGDPRYLI